MKRRHRVHSPKTHRFSKYLKPGALARLRDSRIQSHYFLTHRVNSLTRSLPQSPTPPHVDSQTEFVLPEFPDLDRGRPHCYGRKKLAAAATVTKASFITSVSENTNDSFISVVNTNLLVH
ncbi:hypothetical protein BVRB_4g088440 [Beta vulgaris subsp. vulgaris]|nr:hypothetical protein BVRB_4g088440 [Beta vulgaris subsp. vulgaris]